MSDPIPATEFKATCLALLDRVSERRESFVISKHGRAVAKLVPVARSRKRGPLVGCMQVVDDADDLLSTGDAWDIDSGRT